MSKAIWVARSAASVITRIANEDDPTDRTALHRIVGSRPTVGYDTLAREAEKKLARKHVPDVTSGPALGNHSSDNER